MHDSPPLNPTAQPDPRWPGLVLAYAFLALFAAASLRVAGMTALVFGASTLLLCLPALLALWHHSAVGHLVRLHQYSSGSGLRWLASRRLLSMLLLAALAPLLTGAVLLQSVLFGRLEWALMALAPLLHFALHALLKHFLERQYTHRAYARQGLFWITQALVTLLLALVWLLACFLLAPPPEELLAEVVLGLQKAWAASPSGIIKWGLDASAWVHASADWLQRAPNALGWRLMAALLFTPLAVFGHLALTLSGLSLPLAEIRRTLGSSLTDADMPPPVGPARAAMLAAVAAVGVMLVAQLTATLEQWMKPQDSPLAVQALPECERIGGALYRVNTIRALQAFMAVLDTHIAGQQGGACKGLSDITTASQQGVDNYLDWYFSLGAEWARTVALLTGGADDLLANRFHDLVLSQPAVKQRLQALSGQFDHLSLLGSEGKRGALELLRQQRLTLTDQQCRVVQTLPTDPWSPGFDRLGQRLSAGSASGLLAGVVAAKITAKAMAKASMKLAGKVLAKAAVKKGASKAGSAVAGAALGTAIAPGVGTLAGAVIGLGVGVTVGVAVDLVTLAAEERLTRPDMRQDLLAAITETMQPYREAFGCGP